MSSVTKPAPAISGSIRDWSVKTAQIFLSGRRNFDRVFARRTTIRVRLAGVAVERDNYQDTGATYRSHSPQKNHYTREVTGVTFCHERIDDAAHNKGPLNCVQESDDRNRRVATLEIENESIAVQSSRNF
jgi:hypothetical protein